MNKTKERRPTFVSVFGNILAKKEGGWFCHYCGIMLVRKSKPLPTSATVDHQIPVCKGGKSLIENMVLSCTACNNEKGEGDYLEFLQKKAEIRLKRGLKRGGGRTIKKHRKGAK